MANKGSRSSSRFQRHPHSSSCTVFRCGCSSTPKLHFDFRRQFETELCHLRTLSRSTATLATLHSTTSVRVTAVHLGIGLRQALADALHPLDTAACCKFDRQRYKALQRATSAISNGPPNPAIMTILIFATHLTSYWPPTTMSTCARLRPCLRIRCCRCPGKIALSPLSSSSSFPPNETYTVPAST